MRGRAKLTVLLLALTAAIALVLGLWLLIRSLWWTPASPTPLIDIDPYVRSQAGEDIGLALLYAQFWETHGASSDETDAARRWLNRGAPGELPPTGAVKKYAGIRSELEELLRMGIPQRARFNDDVVLTTIIEYAPTAGGVAALCLAYAADAWRTGKRDEAIELFRVPLIFADVLSYRPTMLQASCAAAIRLYVARAIELTVLSGAEPSPEECDRIIALLLPERNKGAEALPESARAMYAMWWNSIRHLERDAVLARELCSDISGEPCPPPATSRRQWCAAIRHHLFAHFVADPEVMRQAINKWYGLTFEAIATASTPGELIRQLRQIDAKASQSSLASYLVDFNTDVAINLFDVDARIEATVAAVVWLRYRKLHGGEPPSLEAAARDAGVEPPPVDIYTGQPLRVVRQGRAVLFYSLGWDGQDNGARQRPPGRRRPAKQMIQWDVVVRLTP